MSTFGAAYNAGMQYNANSAAYAMNYGYPGMMAPPPPPNPYGMAGGGYQMMGPPSYPPPPPLPASYTSQGQGQQVGGQYGSVGYIQQQTPQSMQQTPYGYPPPQAQAPPPQYNQYGQAIGAYGAAQQPPPMPQVVYSQAPYDAGGTGAGEHRQAPKLPEHTATGFLQQSQQLGQGGGGGFGAF